MRKIIAIACLLLLLLLSTLNQLTAWENMSIVLFIYVFLDFLYNLGKKVVLLDLTVIMAVLTCLIMPVIFYHFYTRDNFLARLWVKYMPISLESYFSFAFPAVVTMTIGLKLPLGKLKFRKHPEIFMDNVRRQLALQPNLGLRLVAVGFVCGLLDALVPGSIREFFYLTAHLTHVGVFYVFYSPNKQKRLIVPGVILLVIAQSILTGMFGELVFMLACSMVLVLLGQQVSFRRKIVLALSGLFLIMVIQAVKKDYRKISWTQGASTSLFVELIVDRVTSPSTMLDPNQMFYTSTRMNQGWLVAETIYQVPYKHPFAYGETIWQSIAATFVPRFLWPTKPESGGKANLKRFWGFDLVGWSTNIGPMGEAYANFDRTGGIVYMFFYGLLFNFILFLILKKSERRPTLVLWIPFLFFNALTVETDLLSTMGAVIKSAIFMWIVFLLFKKGFQIDL